MRTLVTWVALVLGIVVAIAAGIAAYRLAGFSWNQVVDYRSPYLGSALPTASAPPPQARRVVLVIVDGLTVEASRKMTGLTTLRNYGNDLTLLTAQPSLSYPDWTTILSGAPQQVSGVATNWYEGRVRVETLLDTALGAGRKVVVAGPKSLVTLYGADRAAGAYFHDYESGTYGSSDIVQRAIELIARDDPSFVLLQLPDVDEAGHRSGAASADYSSTVTKVDTDLSLLIRYLQDARTTFVVVSDHGHIATGGHGGWERDVVNVPAIIAGPGVALGAGTGGLEDLAPTVAALAGIPIPRDSMGHLLESVPGTGMAEATKAIHEQRARFLADYLPAVWGRTLQSPGVLPLSARTDAELDAYVVDANRSREEEERRTRAPVAFAVAVCALAVVGVVGLMSVRALLAALAGTAAYYAVYETLFFGVHGYRWSLSSMNSEGLMKAFFNGRLAEAAVAGVVAVLVAGAVYPLLRERPRSARGEFLSGWLSLGPATVLVAQATLALQVAYYLWAWGATVTWTIPDLKLGLKYDLDLLQIVALGAVAAVSPLVTLLVGRYHPRVARREPVRTPAATAGDEE